MFTSETMTEYDTTSEIQTLMKDCYLCFSGADRGPLLQMRWSSLRH